jgi:hypothetical protein
MREICDQFRHESRIFLIRIIKILQESTFLSPLREPLCVDLYTDRHEKTPEVTLWGQFF